MDRREAFDILGLEPTSREEAIRTRYNELLMEVHPDQGGSEEELKRLNVARDTILGDRTTEIERVETSLEKYTTSVLDRREKRSASEKTVKRLKKRSMSKYRTYRHITIGLAGIIAIFMIFYRIAVRGGVFSDPFYAAAFLAYPGMLGMVAWAFHTQMRRIQVLIDEADEDLDDKMRFVRLLQNIGFDYREKSEFTQPELIEYVEEWSYDSSSFHLLNYNPLIFNPQLDYQWLADEIGSTEFSRLLIRKGQAQGVITEHEEIDDGEWIVKYVIKTPDN